MSLKHNVAANFISQAWLVLLTFALVPLYIRCLGIEAYGLIGLFVALQAWITVVDLGLSYTLNREMARFSAGDGDGSDGGDELHQLLGATQWLYGGIGVLIAAGVWVAAPYLAEHWFRASGLSTEVVQASLRLLGLNLVLRWAAQIYRSAIQGLQRQVWLAVFTVLSTTVRSAGAVWLLVWGGANVVDFFVWQLIVTMVELGWLVWQLHHCMPARAAAARPSLAPLRKVWRFAGAVLVTNVCAALMTQSDKLILSRMLPLQEFGYYTFAYTLGTAVAVFTTPIFQAVSPRFTADIVSGDLNRLIATYRKASQTMAVIVLPLAAVMICHAHALIYAWSGDAVLAERSAAIAAVFVGAYMLNSLVHIPAALALSHGWAAWGMISNLVATLLVVPGVVIGMLQFGAIGAALANLGLNVLYFVVAVRFLHRRYLVLQWRAWFWFDSLLPMAVAFAVAGASVLVQGSGGGRVMTAAFLVAAWVVASLAVVLSLPFPRHLLLQGLARLGRALGLRLSRQP
jgi:O-antigen/teichoic acid export membrane protein